MVATESTRPAANAEDIVTSSSSTERFVETALDINDKGDEDSDEATVETYEDDEDDGGRGEASRTRKATPQFMKTTPTNGEVDESEEASTHQRDGEREAQADGEADAPDEGSGVSDGSEGSGGEGDEGAAASASYGGDGVGVGVGVDGEANDETSEVSTLEQRGHDRLASIMMREVTRLIDYALEQQRSVVNQFLQDETIEMVKCATMEAVKKSCATFMADVREALKMNKGNDFPTQLAQFGVKTLMARDFEMFVQQHNTTRIKQPTAENVIIDNALRKAGMLLIEVELQKRFVDFSKLFYSTVGEYVDRLLANEQQQRSDFDESLVEWYRKYSVATTVSSQVIVLSKFLPLYKDIFHQIKMDAD